MSRPLLLGALLLVSCRAFGQEAAAGTPPEESAAAAQPAGERPAARQAPDDGAAEPLADQPQGDGIDSPKTLSGMSILGNEEAPKSLVIIPWKSSELGDDISLSDSLDDRARPVDKEVFLRELNFYEIRSGGE